MIILGIETSCDETAASVVQDGAKVFSSVVASSEAIHKKYGGIVPEQAAREQVKCIIPVIQEALFQARLDRSYKPGLGKIDAIAVTIGPGLIGSLLVGVETAKTLSYVWKKPLVPVNHLTAHIYANFVDNNLTIKQFNNKTLFPAVCLIASGGHTLLVLMKRRGQFKVIGQTRDDAAGECFDKTARLLGFGYPGGPEIEKAAKKTGFSLKKPGFPIKLPRPMINENNFDFSFSGLKTAAFYNFKKKNCSINYWAYEIQEAITDVLVKKTLKAAKDFKAKSVLIGGGVTANQRLREKLKLAIGKLENWKIRLFIPDKKWCTDNGAIIATTAFYNFKPTHWSKIKPNPSLEII